LDTDEEDDEYDDDEMDESLDSAMRDINVRIEGDFDLDDDDDDDSDDAVYTEGEDGTLNAISASNLLVMDKVYDTANLALPSFPVTEKMLLPEEENFASKLSKFDQYIMDTDNGDAVSIISSVNGLNVEVQEMGLWGLKWPSIFTSTPNAKTNGVNHFFDSALDEGDGEYDSDAEDM
jgi:hypothetical protein